jgi:hypothetical protein
MADAFPLHPGEEGVRFDLLRACLGSEPLLGLLDEELGDEILQKKKQLMLLLLLLLLLIMMMMMMMMMRGGRGGGGGRRGLRELLPAMEMAMEMEMEMAMEMAMEMVKDRPWPRGEGELLVQDVVEGASSIAAMEGRLAVGHLEEEDAEAPPVCRESMAMALPEDGFGADVVFRADDGETRSRRWRWRWRWR